MIEIKQGDCLQVLKTMDDESMDCCVTSPPYWGLRDYGVEGQLGLEESLQTFLKNMCDVFQEVNRVLKPEGTLWLNMGDCYAGSNKGRGDSNIMESKQATNLASHTTQALKIPEGLKPKDLMGVPWRLAFALQDMGWYLRMDIIWHKPNPMPESVTDRPTKAHEYIFLMSKSKQYYYDQEATLVDVSPNTHARLSQDVMAQVGSDRAYGGQKTNGKMKAVARKGSGVGFGHGTDKEDRQRPRIKDNESFDSALALIPEKRNIRSVWKIPTHSFKEAHFATYPPDLIEPCILAGCPEGGTVLDPFFGAGTTGLVSDRLGRNCIGIELNPEYIEIAMKRLQDDGGMFLDLKVETQR